MTRHVSTEDLARLADGDLTGAADRQARSHLDECQDCRADLAALSRIPALLADVPAPPMPARLSARIDAAMAAESARRAADQAPGLVSVPGQPGIPSPSGAVPPADHSAHGDSHRVRGRARRARRPVLTLAGTRILAAAAAIVIIGGGGYGLVRYLEEGQAAGTSSASSTSGGLSGSSPDAGPRAPAIGPVYGPLVQYRAAGRIAAVRPVRSGTDYQPSRLTEQVTREMAQFPHGLGQLAPNASPDAGQTFGDVSLSRLSGCISRVAAGRLVQLVDVAAFDGKPATVIVTGAPGQSRQAIVVGPGCSSRAGDVLARRVIPGN